MTFKLRCLTVDYEYWLNANNAQMNAGPATDTGECKFAIGGGSVVVDSLFNMLPPLFVGTLCFVLVV